MIVWNLIDDNGGGIVAASIAGAIFAVPMVALWLAKARFNTSKTTH